MLQLRDQLRGSRTGHECSKGGRVGGIGTATCTQQHTVDFASHALLRCCLQIDIRLQDIATADLDWSTVDVVLVYLTVSGLKQISPLLLPRLAPGTRVVCARWNIVTPVEPEQTVCAMCDLGKQHGMQEFRFFRNIIPTSKPAATATATDTTATATATASS